MKLSVPLKSRAGVYGIVPLVLRVATPFAGVPTVVTVRVSPAGLESLASTATTTAVSSSVVAWSAPAVGGGFWTSKAPISTLPWEMRENPGPRWS